MCPDIDWRALPSPCYIVDEALLVRNLELLREVAQAAGCRILLAQKGFSMYAAYPLIAGYLDGAAASSLFEARLAAEEMGGEVHIYAPAYRADEFPKITKLCSHIIFNSFDQWRLFRGDTGGAECGIRVNPGYSEVAAQIYNPCAPYSRLGVPADAFEREAGAGSTGAGSTGTSGSGASAGTSGTSTSARNSTGASASAGTGTSGSGVCDSANAGSTGAGSTGASGSGAGGRYPGLEGLSGLHFHTMCEQGADTLRRTLGVVREKFGRYLPHFRWVNFGGGQLITKPGYDIDTFVRCVREFSERFGVRVYVEPGEAIALNTGFLVATVLGVADNGMLTAILDASATCHMPDVLEAPYRPDVIGAADPSAPGFDGAAYPHTYRLAGPTCLAGDVIGDYAFKSPLVSGDRLVFTDMAHYTMVKNNTFNGIGLPAIAMNTRADGIKVIRRFGYEDFKRRLS